MIERIVTPRLADIIEAIERIRRVLDGVTLEAFEQSWEKRWLVERGVEVISEASRYLTDDIKERRTEVPWSVFLAIVAVKMLAPTVDVVHSIFVHTPPRDW
jgi:uncharacterized protein with HEPN domain